MTQTPLKIHLIGAGGIGMSGLRIWLESAGYVVSCSDDRAMIPGFIPESQIVSDADYIVASSAIKPDHPQYKYAKENGMKLISRARMTKKLMHGKVVSVTGSHGKSTTSGMISYVLKQNYEDTSFLVGAILKNFDTSARYSPTEGYCVVEADESDNSMNVMTGEYHLITNIKEEHIDYYGSFEKYWEQMRVFSEISRVTICHVSCKEYLPKADLILYGAGGSFYASNKQINQSGSIFDLHTPGGTWPKMKIQLKGEHMIENAVGAAAMLLQLGLSEVQIRAGLASFQGVKRRMEEFKYNGKLIIQDYANHPNDISCVIETISKIYKNQALAVLWEPHRFSRIRYKDNLDRIIQSFKVAKEILLLPVWSAGEPQDPDLSQEKIYEKFAANGIKSFPVKNRDEIKNYIDKMPPGSVLIAFGSGGIYNLVNELLGLQNK